MSSMKICMVSQEINPPWIEGGSKSIFYISKRLVKAGYDVHIVTNQPYNADNENNHENGEIEGVIFHRGKMLFKVPPTISDKALFLHLNRHISIAIKLFRVLKKNKFDILHGYSFSPLLAVETIIGKKLFNITSIHTFNGDSYENSSMSTVYLKHLKKLDNIVAVTESRYNQLVDKIDKDKLVYIPNGVDTNELNPHAKSNIREELVILDKPLILYIGHLSKKKGVEYLIKSAPLVLEKFPKAKFLIAWSGVGDQMRELKGLINKLNLNNSFIFTGKRDDLAGVYATSDLFVLPLISEKQTLGYPLTILEALSCGVPVISTDFPNICEIIKNGVNGFVVEPKDYVGLAQKINTILGETKLRNAMGEKGRQMILNNFSLERTLNRYVELYESKRGNIIG